MKDFDLDKIGRKMPYSAPSEAFFEQLTQDTLQEVRRRKSRRTYIRNIFISTISVAATIAVLFNVIPNRTSTVDALNRFDASLDLYVENLSDEELSSMLLDMEYESEFYANL